MQLIEIDEFGSRKNKKTKGTLRKTKKQNFIRKILCPLNERERERKRRLGSKQENQNIKKTQKG